MTEQTPFYATTAISYPNGAPHIGHAYEAIAADTLVRFQRLDGVATRFQTGTDEHGQKMQQTAEKLGTTPRELADANSARFREMDDELGISYDRFIRTTDEDHAAASQELWKRMEANGDIYLDTYAGWYSVRDEAYYAEDETEVRADGQRYSIGTGTELTWTEEESYFFRLSRYQDRLLELYRTDFVQPETRSHEIASFVGGGLQDLSISRTTFDWGVPVPGNPDHVMYVWVDALTNYLTGLGFPDTDAPLFREFWPASVHLIGKDIARFHAVYWPAFLMSAGIELPRKVFAHGFLFNQGEKMSKSVGNVIDPHAMVEEYGLDQLRFFLLREVPFGQDGNYSHDAIAGRINSDLANDLGNLAQRSLSMVAKNLGGEVPEPGEFTAEDLAMLAQAEDVVAEYRSAFEALAFHRGLESVWRVIASANRYFTAQEPWVLRKTDPERMATVLYVTAEVLRIVAVLVQPVMPGSMARLLEQLGQPEGEARMFSALGTRLAPGTVLPKPSGVFPRYEEPAALAD
ncbi:methionine--tRNA ligase [Kocuria rhizophila]|uniref:Methionine--tRNA ligase n=1 Tax=Kocuria rhizophila (strain ATCC 9341 / DSM 348 / NBRC 103217 / DC2201) TaxID=378753 RepID=B2GFJ8_KOCRD|nr:methionine--tRNA ligase [Kocuria rhizophila]ASE10716.1 methionine--tRNA ligase [Kocuria rhizophila]MBK4119581.1 methionine--tRNA ligase [Kocuria rhizophila]MCC5673859.1 methionine--tRNA ligase [Kocuria rhizophila]MDV5998930.1 methionine--tRNA ligase [Kocuria rhizophila]VEH75350.1 Methionine--tRNA ligase [Kocuria rhizophila]